MSLPTFVSVGICCTSIVVFVRVQTNEKASGYQVVTDTGKSTNEALLVCQSY